MGVLSGLAKILLCGTFCLSGICKLTPKWGADVYAAMDEAFQDRFTPFWQQMFLFSEMGVELNATALKLLFGSTEVLCAVLLFTSFKFTASIVLFGLMSAVLLTHLFLGEFAEMPMPLVLCLASLCVGFIGYSPMDQKYRPHSADKSSSVSGTSEGTDGARRSTKIRVSERAAA